MRRLDRHLPLRRCLLSCGLLVILIASGTTFGWTALEVALKRQGVYPHLTPAERNAKLQAVMTIAGVALGVGGILFGLLLDFAGPAVTNAASGLLFAAGCVIFGYNISYEVGYSCLALAGAGVLSAGFRLGGVFPMYTAYIMTAVTCCFDSSTIVFLIYDTLNLKVGLSQKVFFSCLAGVVLCLQCGMACMWSVYLKHKPVIDEAEEREATVEAEKLLLIAEEMEKALAGEGGEVVPLPAHTATSRKGSVFSGVIREEVTGLLSDADGRSVTSSHKTPSVHSVGTQEAVVYTVKRRRRHSTVTMMEEALAMEPEEREKNLPLSGDEDLIVEVTEAPGWGSRSGSVLSGRKSVVLLKSSRRHPSPARFVSPGRYASPVRFASPVRRGDPLTNSVNSVPFAGYGTTPSAATPALSIKTPFGLPPLLEDRTTSTATASPSANTHIPSEDHPPYIPMLHRSYKEQVMSVEYGFLLAVTCISLYRIGWFMSSTQPFLESIGDKGNKYAQLVALVLPFEALLVPLTIFIIQRKGLYIGALAAVAAAAAQSVIECVAVLPLQLLAAVAVVAFRSLSQSVINTFTVRVFGTRNVGRHAGSLRAIAGTITLTQIPLMTFVQTKLHGKFNDIHYGSCALVLLLLLLCLWLRCVSKESIIFHSLSAVKR